MAINLFYLVNEVKDHRLYIVRTEFELRVCYWTISQIVDEFLIPYLTCK